MFQRALSPLPGSGGGTNPTYILVKFHYSSLGYADTFFYSTKDTAGFTTVATDTAGLDYDDDNINLTRTGQNAFTITFKKSAKMIYSASKTEVNFTAGQTYNVPNDNSATNPYMIIMQ